MPYTSSLNIEKIATGTGTGTWGNSTNVNWDRIDAFSGGYISISLNSITAYTLDTFEGAVPDAAGTAGDGGGTGWNKNIVFTGSPGGTVTVTIKPVTSKKWYFVRNDTSPAQTITFQQTPGTTVSLASGYSTIIYCTGANVVRAIDDLEIDSLKVNTLLPIGVSGRTSNVIIGLDAGAVGTGVSDSVLIGKEAGKTITTGDSNVVVGAFAAKSASIAIEGTVIIGESAGVGHAADNCVVIGNSACNVGCTGIRNTVVGDSAGFFITSGPDNTFIGANSGLSDTVNKLTGDSNVGVGSHSLFALTSGVGNVAIGKNTLLDCTEGGGNVALGSASAGNITSGDANITIGQSSGLGLTTEDRNILIGNGVGTTATGADDILAIDHENKAINQSSTYFIYGDMGNDLLNFNSASSSGSHVKIQNTNAAGSGYNFLECVADSDGSPATKFQVRGDGQVQVNGVEVHAADYADMFEWSDGNPEAEDRIGLSVVLDDGGVLPATVRDDPDDIVGVVSGTACMIGNSAWGAWDNKFLKDDFGRVVMETVDEKATPILNPEYDEAREYHARMARSEWAVIGLTGRIHLRKGSPTHPSWKKIRDVSAVSEEWLVR